MGGFVRRMSAVGAAAGVVAAQLVVQVLSAEPAAAAVPGLRVVHEVSESDSDSTKVVFADCGDGEVILGGGGAVSNGGGHVTLHWLEPRKVIGTGGTLFGGYGRVTYHSLAPNSEGTRVTVLGVVDGPPFVNRAEFGVRATAVCANPPSHWGWQMVSASTPVSDAAAKAVQRQCPGGKHVTGLGVSRTVVNGHAFVDGMCPGSAGRDAVVVGHQRAPRTDWDLTATAICAVA